MTSDRPYRLGTELQFALKEIEKESGSKLDPEAVRACLRLFRDQGFELPGTL